MPYLLRSTSHWDVDGIITHKRDFRQLFTLTVTRSHERQADVAVTPKVIVNLHKAALFSFFF
jgi:hypothetical protein